jgi:Rrf2 family protein
MRWNKSTRLALYAALELAQAGDQLATAAGIATKYNVSTHHLAKVLQQLARAGVAQAVLGVGGGYRLAKSAKDITLLDVVEIFEGRSTVEGCCALAEESEDCGKSAACRLKRVFDEIELQAVFTLKSVRLSTLAASTAGPPAAGGRPGLPLRS